MRTVEHRYDEDAMARLVAATDLPAVHQALGKLAVWGAQRLPLCKVFIEHKEGWPPQITGVYFDGTEPEGKCAFQLGAVWRDGKFEFHS